MKVEKVIIFSVLVSATMIIWYEVLGVGFLLWVVAITVYVMLFPRRWRK